jgi:predicted amidohydrolase YtcJ
MFLLIEMRFAVPPADQPRTVIVGNIRTMADGGAGTARAMLIEAGRVVALADEPARFLELADATVLDVGDRTVMPGFVDAHAHVELCSVAHDMVDCRVPRRHGIPDVLDALSDGIRTLDPDAKWLLGQANLFFDQKLAERRYPTRAELDSVSSSVAIGIRAGGHASLLNSRAIELINAEALQTGQTGFSGKMVIDRTEDGRVSGLVSEVDKYIPELYSTEADLKDSIRRGVQALWTRFGVTTIGEMSESIGGLGALDELIDQGEVAPRIIAYIMAPTTLPLEDAYNWGQHLTLRSAADRMTIRGIKMFCDGGYSARNAATRQPFIDERAVEAHPCGQINLERDALAEVITRTRELGMQLAVHVNGERAQAEVAAAVLAADTPNKRPPVRAEHAGNLITDWATVEAWRSADLVPVPQPTFLYNFGAYIPKVLGPAVDRGQFRFRSLLDDGWRLAAGSDLCIGGEERQSNPLFGVWCAVKREGFVGELIGDEAERISVDEALLMHTIYAAEALGVGDDRGTLEPGKLADVIVLDRDPGAVAVDDLLEINVDEVFVSGRSVYQRVETPER